MKTYLTEIFRMFGYSNFEEVGGGGILGNTLFKMAINRGKLERYTNLFPKNLYFPEKIPRYYIIDLWLSNFMLHAFLEKLHVPGATLIFLLVSFKNRKMGAKEKQQKHTNNTIYFTFNVIYIQYLLLISKIGLSNFTYLFNFCGYLAHLHRLVCM